VGTGRADRRWPLLAARSWQARRRAAAEAPCLRALLVAWSFLRACPGASPSPRTPVGSPRTPVGSPRSPPGSQLPPARTPGAPKRSCTRLQQAVRAELPGGAPAMLFAAGSLRQEVEAQAAWRLGVEPEDLDLPWMLGEDFEGTALTIGVLGGKVASDQMTIELRGFPGVAVAAFPRGTFLRAARRSVAELLGLPTAVLRFPWALLLEQDFEETVATVQALVPLPKFAEQEHEVLFLSGASQTIPARFPLAGVLPCLAARLGCQPRQVRLLQGTEAFRGWGVLEEPGVLTACAVHEPQAPILAAALPPWRL